MALSIYDPPTDKDREVYNYYRNLKAMAQIKTETIRRKNPKLLTQFGIWKPVRDFKARNLDSIQRYQHFLKKKNFRPLPLSTLKKDKDMDTSDFVRRADLDAFVNEVLTEAKRRVAEEDRQDYAVVMERRQARTKWLLVIGFFCFGMGQLIAAVVATWVAIHGN